MSATRWMAVGSLVLVALAIGLGVFVLATASDTPVHRAWRWHTASLHRLVRMMHYDHERVTGLKIARYQLWSIGLLLLAGFFFQDALVFVVCIAVLIALFPRIWLQSKVDERREKVDAQLDSFLVTLSNALKVSPSLGDALANTANLLRAPIKEEIEDALKEYQLGVPLDQALLSMAARLESRPFNAAVSSLLIGKQTGGDLPKLLDRSAATLREMARLEGVVRSKTAEGKSQAFVLGAIPFFIILALSFIDPTWLQPLTTSAWGYVITGAAAVLWIAGVFAARKILDVDI